MSDYLLDSSAVLALMFGEPGKDRVEEILESSMIGRINVIEVLTKLLERGALLTEAIENLDELNLSVAELNEKQSIKIAELRPITKHFGLSLGDRACLALAIQENATVVTADRDWARLDICKIDVIR